MGWFVSLFIALIAGGTGLVASAFVADAYIHWYRVSSFEGASGYFAVGMSLLGGIVSSVVGLIVARVVAAGANPSFIKGTVASLGTVLLIHALVALVCYWFADIPPKIGGDRLRLEVEIRLPVGMQTPPDELEGKPFFQLESIVRRRQRAVEYGRLKIDQSHYENGRWIVPAEVFVFTSRGLRGISAQVGEENIAQFLVPLPAYPDRTFEQWSHWLPKPPDGTPLWPDTQASYRFRVQRIPPPAPPPTQEELDALKEAKEQATFDAIPLDAPIPAWLPYTEEWQNAKRREVAIERITSRKEYVSELNALMLDTDPRKAAAALRFIGSLPAPDPALVPAVSAAGRDIIFRIQRVNETSIEQDPSYEGAADASIRFSAWMSSVRALRNHSQGDFTPELQEILNLSRVRKDSIVMRDINRVASHYMKQWGGVDPLPGDPSP